MKKIVIFGGTFDPVHIGHLSIYKSIKKQIQFDKFIIVPSKNPPLKTHSVYASAVDRVAMLKLMFKNFDDVVISDYELSSKNNKVSYTINTIKYFKKQYPKKQLFLAIGSDRYNDFKQWKDWKKILTNVTLIVVPRNTISKQEIQNVIFIKTTPVNISSSSLRILPQRKYLTKHVTEYIANNGIYIEQQIKPLMSIKRFKHTERVTKLAIELAESIDNRIIKHIYIASMYHDVCKEFSNDKILQYINSTQKSPPNMIHTLHGVAGAQYVKQNFNIKNKYVLDAIANHVIPKKNPSILTKILYCADKLEPARTSDDVKNRIQMIRLVKKNINKYFLKLFSEINAKYN